MPITPLHNHTPFIHTCCTSAPSQSHRSIQSPLFPASHQVAELINLPGQRFRGKGETAKHAAVVEIQAGARRWLAQRAVTHRHKLQAAARRVAYRWHTKQMWKAMRARLAAEATERQREWDGVQNRFRIDWPQTKIGPRVVVHIASLSHAAAARALMPNLDVAQSAQLPRLCEVMEPGVDVIYVSPFPLNDDVANYYQKVSVGRGR